MSGGAQTCFDFGQRVCLSGWVFLSLPRYDLGFLKPPLPPSFVFILGVCLYG